MNKVEKIGFLEKSAYALINVGNIPIMTLINSFLLIYYVDVVGISPASVGTLFLITRILDGISDPIMGFVIDHLPATKMGRFRPYIIIGAIFCVLNFLLLWFGPLLFTSIKLIVVYISYLLIGITFDIMDIPLNSMLPVMTDDLKERNSLSSLKGVAYAVGGLSIGIIAPLILSMAATPLQGYTIIIIAASVIVLLFTTLGALGIKERIEPISEEKYKVKDIVPILTTRPVLVTFGTQLFTGISSSISGATAIFFAMYVLDNRPEILSVIGIISLLGAFLGMFSSGYITNRLGKKVVYSAGLIIIALFTLLRLFDVTNITLFYACSFLGGIGGGLMIPLQYGIQADNVDYVEYKLNKRAEGVLASSNSFLTKAGQGIGGALPGYILAAVGYVPNVQQTPSALNGIILLSIILPALFMIIGAVIFGGGYNLNKQNTEEIMNELKVKRTEKLVLSEGMNTGEFSVSNIQNVNAAEN
ncbi:MFS transporter [Trichococcus flocculiformis]|uniref:MFS transporter n=1 Tax=Trichococcus flocculiformis TaxID=82803 RepID=UPI003DA3B920